MSGRGAARLVWGLSAVAVVLIGSGAVFLVVNGGVIEERPDWEWIFGLGVLLLFLAFGTAGALIASRQPRNPIGWMFCVVGLSGPLGIAADGYAVYALRTRPGSLPGGELAAWLVGWLGGPSIIALFAFVFLLFPRGTLVSTRWRPVVWLNLAGVVLAFLWTFAPGEIEGLSTNVENPFGVERAKTALEVAGLVGFGLMVAATGGGFASLVVRFRRARGEERQQLKWFAFAAALFLGAFLAGPVIWNVPALEPTPLWPIVFLVCVGTLPIATGIAILKYRLYDIDVVINRTLVYGSLTALLAGTYLGLVLLLQLALEPVTEGNELAVAVSTLAVAALFRPARRRIQEAVDRRFYRRKYDAERTLAAFSARLRDEVELEALAADLRAVVSETVQPAHVSLWLREAPR